MGEVTEISDRHVAEQIRLDPAYAARAMGIIDPDGRLTDYSPAGWEAQAALARTTEAALRAATPADEAERLAQLYLLSRLDADIALAELGERERVVSAGSGPPALVRMTFDLVPHEREEDWELVGKMLRNVPDSMAGYRTSLERAAGRGHTAAALTVAGVADQCATWGSGWFTQHVAQYGDGSLRTELDAAASDACAAYSALAEWLRTDYLPVATEEIGVGEERYRAWQRLMLGAEVDLDDAYAWGWEELARIEDQQRAECDRILPGAGFDEVRALLETDPARAVHGVEEYRQWLQDVSDEAIDKLDGWQFDIPEPLRRCEIGIPPAGTAAAPYYTPPSEDLSQPGRTWFPTLGRTTFPMWDQVTIAYHEAVPGHHLQFGAVRVLDLLRAHRLGISSAHCEGWALYAERLMDELGEFGTPDTRLGFLASQAFRAARVVVDIGMHTHRPLPDGRRWSPELVKEHLRRSSGFTDAFVESEVRRYAASPAQATGYKLGERAWLAGRDAARAARGADFDLKRWHAAALALGPLGLGDLEAELARVGSERSAGS